MNRRNFLLASLGGTATLTTMGYSSIISFLNGNRGNNSLNICPENSDLKTLRDIASSRGKSIGSCVRLDALNNDQTYREVLAREYNMLTLENELKMYLTQPERGRYDFSHADPIVEFAEVNNMKVRGVPLLWHLQNPDWFEGGSFTSSELLKLMEEHISTLVDHYKGRVFAWDVVNEPFEDKGFRHNRWFAVIGEDYIPRALEIAHSVDPEARLFLNDFHSEGLNKKSDTIYGYARSLLDKGAPLHGIGTQMHVSLKNQPDPKEVTANIRRLTKLGLEFHITEFDVKTENIDASVEEKDRRTADLYRNIMRVCLDNDSCSVFGMWAFTDKYSWLHQFTENPNQRPSHFDKDYNPKPAYFATKEALCTG